MDVLVAAEAGMGRLLRLGAFGVGITAIAVDNPTPASPVK